MSSSAFRFDHKEIRVSGNRHLSLSRDEFNTFKPSSINGNGRSPTKFDALTAFLDLEGFTSFCGNPDAHLFINRFVADFEDWMFEKLKQLLTKDGASALDEHVLLWDPLPIFWKPTGDGGFFIWNLGIANWDGDKSVGNIVVHCHELVRTYRTEFLPRARRDFDQDLPMRLRCGLARGEVMSIRDGADYVAPSINFAAHLQKLRTVEFAVRATGIDPAKCFSQEYAKRYVLKRVNIHGQPSPTRIFVDCEEYAQLNDRARNAFCDA